jgi:soluble lytic murein transglycosylase
LALRFFFSIHNVGMQVFKTFILAGLCTVSLATSAFAQAQRGDDVMVQMSEAAKRGDKARLAALLPQARGHVLEPLAVYLEMKARLKEASAAEVQAAIQSIAGTYHEDRLRNDWLQLLGERRDWSAFSAEYAKFRMNDDREVRCYALHIDRLRGAIQGDAAAPEVLRNWYGLRDAEDGCTLAAGGLLEAKQITALDVWKEARLSIESNRARAAAQAVTLVAPEATAAVGEIQANPGRYLAARNLPAGNTRKELVTLALIKMASNDPQAAASAMEAKWAAHLTPEERSWVWAVIGKQANLKLSAEAGEYFSKARNEHLNDDLLGWKARAALRSTIATQGWPVVLAAINAMSDEGKKDSTWVYWKARALRELAKGKPETVNTTPQSPTPTMVLRPELQEAQNLLEGIASVRGFYEMLATEEIGRKVALPQSPPALTAIEKEAARLNPGLNRALYAIAIGLRSEGVREWNYTANLHTRVAGSG